MDRSWRFALFTGGSLFRQGVSNFAMEACIVVEFSSKMALFNQGLTIYPVW